MLELTLEEKRLKSSECTKRISNAEKELKDFVEPRTSEIAEFCVSAYKTYLTDNNITRNDLIHLTYLHKPYFMDNNTAIFNFYNVFSLKLSLNTKLDTVIKNMPETKADISLPECYTKILEYKQEFIKKKNINDQLLKPINEECIPIREDYVDSWTTTPSDVSIESFNIVEKDCSSLHQCIDDFFGNPIGLCFCSEQ